MALSGRVPASAVAGEALLTAFFLLEPRLRRGEPARSLSADAGDRGSTRALAAATLVAGAGAPALGLPAGARLPARDGWAGVCLMGGGLALRVVSARRLGAHYTRTLRVSADQAVVDSGPYRFVRHPGYAGVLLLWLGYGLAWTRPSTVAVTILPTAVAYARRIAAEEALLGERLGDAYRDYRRRTARLVPGVF